MSCRIMRKPIECHDDWNVNVDTTTFFYRNVVVVIVVDVVVVVVAGS